MSPATVTENLGNVGNRLGCAEVGALVSPGKASCLIQGKALRAIGLLRLCLNVLARQHRWTNSEHSPSTSLGAFMLRISYCFGQRQSRLRRGECETRRIKDHGATVMSFIEEFMDMEQFW
jgi:hypothetical protein